MDPSEILHFMGILQTVHSQSLGGLEDNLGNVNNGDKQTSSKAKYIHALRLLEAAAQGPAVLAWGQRAARLVHLIVHVT